MKATEDFSLSLNIPLLLNTSCDLEKAPKLPNSSRGRGSGKTETTSFFKTTFNGLNSLSGVGILSIPYALSSGGWLSLILLLIIAIATFYTGLLIQRCMDDVDHHIRSYPDIGDRAFGAKGRALVSLFMNLELFLVATGFLILAGDNLHSLLPNVELHVGGVSVGGRATLVLAVAAVMMPTVWIDDMTTLSYVSATGVGASVVILGSVLWSGIADDVVLHKGELLNWNGLPTALSLYAFCYCAHPVFPTLYTSMTDQRQFSRVLLLCFSFCTFTYASMAILGYLMFGSEVQSQITLNLPTDKLSSKVAIYTALLNPIAKYALMLKPILDSIESSWKKKRVVCRSFARIVLVGSSVLVALTVPFFGDLMALVGAFLSVTASILLPCLCYLKICDNWRKLGCELVIIAFTLVMGLVVFVVGTYTSLVQIAGSL